MTLVERLRLIAAWHKSGGPTPQKPGPNKYQTCTEAADRIEQLEAAVKAQMDAKHKEAAEAKLWFENAQEWKSQNARLEAALREIMALDGEINPSNYGHDDACYLNTQFVYAFTIAKAALEQTEKLQTS